MNPVFDAVVWIVDALMSQTVVLSLVAGTLLIPVLLLFVVRSGAHGRFLPGTSYTSGVLDRTPMPYLHAARRREGLPRATSIPENPRTPPVRIFAWVALACLAIIALLAGLGTARVPVTQPYITAYGTPAQARAEGQWVIFTAHDGVEYRLYNRLFSPSYPTGTLSVYDGDTFTVRYLPNHPQAYVIVADD